MVRDFLCFYADGSISWANEFGRDTKEHTAYMYNPKDLEIEQYTGLRDKNGNEIYEGDVIQNKHGVVEEVVFSIDSFACKKETNYRTMCDWEEVTVIGNIHENPELLEVHHEPNKER